MGLAAAASSNAPYTDPNAVGSIGLCNQAGQQITSGSVTAQPFAWRAVSTQPAQAPYNNAGRTATLVAYQPLQGLPPGDWSGTQMTSSSRYSNAASPMAAATAADQSLQDIIEAYPPRWDGFLQLRIYLGTVNEQAYTLHYPALNIQVTGNTWQAVGGSPVNCASGTSVSLESEVLPSSTTSAPTTFTDDDRLRRSHGHARQRHPEHRSSSVGQQGCLRRFGSGIRGASSGRRQPRFRSRPARARHRTRRFGAAGAFHFHPHPPATPGRPGSGSSHEFFSQHFNERRLTMNSPTRRSTLRALAATASGRHTGGQHRPGEYPAGDAARVQRARRHGSRWATRRRLVASRSTTRQAKSSPAATSLTIRSPPTYRATPPCRAPPRWRTSTASRRSSTSTPELGTKSNSAARRLRTPRRRERSAPQRCPCTPG